MNDDIYERLEILEQSSRGPFSMDRIYNRLADLETRMNAMSDNYDGLVAAVARNESLTQSLLTLTSGLAAQIKQNADNPQALNALAARLQADNDKIAAALVQGTPAAGQDVSSGAEDDKSGGVSTEATNLLKQSQQSSLFPGGGGGQAGGAQTGGQQTAASQTGHAQENPDGVAMSGTAQVDESQTAPGGPLNASNVLSSEAPGDPTPTGGDNVRASEPGTASVANSDGAGPVLAADDAGITPAT